MGGPGLCLLSRAVPRPLKHPADTYQCHKPAPEPSVQQLRGCALYADLVARAGLACPNILLYLVQQLLTGKEQRTRRCLRPAGPGH